VGNVRKGKEEEGRGKGRGDRGERKEADKKRDKVCMRERE
jgi:hypothetical protein